MTLQTNVRKVFEFPAPLTSSNTVEENWMIGGNLVQVCSVLATALAVVTPVSFPLNLQANQDTISSTFSGQVSPNWSADIRLTFTGKNSVWPSVDVGPDDSLNVAWIEGIFNAPMALYFKRVGRNGSVMVDDLKLTNWTEAEPGYSSGDMSPPQIAVDSMGNVHIAWVDRRDVTYGEVYYTMLDLVGNTLIDDTRLTNNANDQEHSLSASVDRYDCVHLFWRVGITVGMPLLYLKIDPSLDNQDGDSADVNAITIIDPMPISYTRAYPRMDVDSQGNVHIFYLGFTYDPLAYRVYYVMLDNVGTILINETEIVAFPTVIDLAMFAGGDGFVHVAWVYDQIYYSKLDPYLDDQDGSPANISQIGIILDRQVSNATGVFTRNPRITEDTSGNVSVVWDQHAAGELAEFFRTKYSVDGTVLIDAEFLTNRYQNVAVIAGFLLDTTVDSTGRVYVVWSDARDAGKDEIYYKYSFDTVKDLPQPVVADAGGPYAGYEGESLTFDAGNSTGTSLEYRWDFDNDGTWDTSWLSEPVYEHIYGDDYDGLVKVEVRTPSGIKEVDVDHMYFHARGFMTFVYKGFYQAQSFVPKETTLAAVDLNLGINHGSPKDLLYVTIRETLDGANLTQASKNPTELEKGCHKQGFLDYHEVTFDFPDITVDPGQKYWIVVTSPGTGGTGIYQICGTSKNYIEGEHWIHGKDGWNRSIQADLRFRTYSAYTPEEQQGPSSIDIVQVKVTNLAPTLSMVVGPPQGEGEDIDFEIKITDPGSDDIEVFWWGDCTGWPSVPKQYPNDPTVVPDPFPSTDINPRDVKDGQLVVCGDDGTYQWNVEVVDDDSGITTMSGTFNVVNELPEYAITFCPQIVGCIPTRYEGESTEYWIILEDPGSDDIDLEWNWSDGSPSEIAIYYNDGIGPDLPNSPNGTYPFPVHDARNHSFGDDGTYNVSVFAEDDDGGMSPIWAEVTILNVAPSLSVAPPQLLIADEGIEVNLRAEAIDLGSDDLTFNWSWEHGKSESHTYYNDGVGPDPPDSPIGTFPFSASSNSTHTYGDDCTCNVTLRVEDDDGGFVTYSTTIEVSNVRPSIVGPMRAYAKGNLTLRIAGEKWHDVVLRLYDSSVETASGSIFRTPGSPDEQSITMEGVVIDLLNNNFTALVEYTPLDDPINGQVNGATPVWLIFTPCDGGEESYLHHAFNVKHPDTWMWEVEDFRLFLVGLNISFEATATDPGSDDLTFTWTWGDGASTSTTFFNDGTGPDTYPSPDINPVTITDVQNHAFISEGLYIVELDIIDDDGGTVHYSFDLTL